MQTVVIFRLQHLFISIYLIVCMFPNENKFVVFDQV